MTDQAALDDSAAALELPPARERILKQIAHEGEHGLRFTLPASRGGRPGRLPTHPRTLLSLKYAAYITKKVKDPKYPDDPPADTTIFEDATTGSGYSLLRVTTEGIEALNAAQARRQRFTDRRVSLDAARVRREPGVSALADFSEEGHMVIDLRAGCPGKAIFKAIDKRLVSAPHLDIKFPFMLHFNLTSMGHVKRKGAGFAADVEETA